MNKTKNNNRRKFLRDGALASMAMLSACTTTASPKATPVNMATPSMPNKLTILFQGDSITDARRERAQYYPNQGQGMGGGYVYQIVSQLLGTHPDKQIRCYNRGISGHKVFQLAGRWEDDCLQLKPDVLSILIGVNDFWHMLNGRYDGTVAVYEKDFHQLLDRTKAALPDVKLMILEPFVVHGGSAVGSPRWKTEFPAYRAAAQKVASEFDATFVKFQTTFDEALKAAPVKYWCPDGVHPSIAGSNIMARDWLKGFEQLKW